MKLSLFIVATAVLSAISVSALPAQQADKSIKANVNSNMKDAHPVGVEMKKGAAAVKVAGDKTKAKTAALPNMPKVSEKVQATNSKLADSITLIAALDGISSDLRKYLETHILDAKNVERTSILLNEVQANPFTVLLILVNLIGRLEDDLKTSIMAPLLPGSDSPPSKFGFTSAEVASFEDEIKKIISEAEGLIGEFKSVLNGKPVTQKFSTITFLNPSEVQNAAKSSAATELPNINVGELPDTVWLSGWADMVSAEAKKILKNVDAAVADASAVDTKVNADETKVEEPLFSISDADIDSFDEVAAAEPTHINKRDMFGDSDFPAPVTAPFVHKEGRMDAPKFAKVNKKAKASHYSHKPEMTTLYMAVPSDVAESFSEFDENDVEGPAPTGSI
ncbi:hypothetical protein INT44_003700 [Umbelopsis vinacea]|uniref:Uncharacterized protein n=1 Tax=Umbelopsis vinacea TaxID=44442 RepID=A0A8H7PUY0_9FUNG|nr:hypothetical protein INT44_003700 [Umbelopsis vinacea]